MTIEVLSQPIKQAIAEHLPTEAYGLGVERKGNLDQFKATTFQQSSQATEERRK